MNQPNPNARPQNQGQLPAEPPTKPIGRAIVGRSLKRVTEEGQDLALKEFRGVAPQWPKKLWKFWRARVRARREFACLRELTAKGVRVPQPRALRRSAVGWEVLMDWIPDAQPLDQWLLISATASGASNELARALGSELARAWKAGLRHADLHAGNVLVRSDGSLVLIDFHAARVRSSLTISGQESDSRDLSENGLKCTLERLWPSLRERAPLEFLHQLAQGWCEAFPDDPQRFRVAQLRAWDHTARLARRRAVWRRRLRWQRHSSSTRSFSFAQSGSGWCRIELSNRELESALQALQKGELHGECPDLIWIADDERATSGCEVFFNAARLEEHGCVCARPWALLSPPTSRKATSQDEGALHKTGALLQLPAGYEPVLAQQDNPAEHDFETPSAGAAWGRLHGRLNDRGLALQDVWVFGSSNQASLELAWGPAEHLAAKPEGKVATPEDEAESALASLPARVTVAFANAFRIAWASEQSGGQSSGRSGSPPANGQ